MFYDIYELDEKLRGNLRKAPKLTYKATHTQETIKKMFHLLFQFLMKQRQLQLKAINQNRLGAANFLNLSHKAFVISNSKQQFHTSSMLGNVEIADNNKPALLDSFTIWVENWSLYPAFTFTKQVSHALVTTLRATSRLITDLLTESR